MKVQWNNMALRHLFKHSKVTIDAEFLHTQDEENQPFMVGWYFGGLLCVELKGPNILVCTGVP